ncbi:uncharacterized protein LOC112694386 [Sipha flava]|uniref:Uncharacterized protein LOC112694386 n=1 Tax=Sipha flava TaxID=143950 RepID=A0A8B8GTL0_9HEMI|nr:uncharacterized protein LOC112694386 [Sipha flava]
MEGSAYHLPNIYECNENFEWLMKVIQQRTILYVREQVFGIFQDFCERWNALQTYSMPILIQKNSSPGPRFVHFARFRFRSNAAELGMFDRPDGIGTNKRRPQSHSPRSMFKGSGRSCVFARTYSIRSINRMRCKGT